MCVRPPTRQDLLFGAKPIAAYLNVKHTQIYHLAATKKLPTFKIGRTVCSTRAKLSDWISEQVSD